MNESNISKLVATTIESFDPKDVNFEEIAKNIRAYSTINMLYGRLPRNESVDWFTDSKDPSVDPALAEQQDRRRQLESALVQEPTPDAEAVKRLVAVHEDRHGFPAFDYESHIKNACCAIAAITGHLPTADRFKASYIGSLNAIQNTSIPCQEPVVVTFDNSALLGELCREGLIDPVNVPAHIFIPFEQERIAHHIADAFSFIKAADEDLHDAILLTIGAIACIRREGSSGTVSSMIGLLWLNPNPAWTVVDYAENIVHEYIHNTIFLADMVQKIFLKPHWFAPQEALVVSAIKKYPRGINIAYHSLFVAMGLIIFLARARQWARAEELTSGLEETLAGLQKKADNFLSLYAQKALKSVDIYSSGS
jgi:hypothetical protein